MKSIGYDAVEEHGKSAPKRRSKAHTVQTASNAKFDVAGRSVFMPVLISPAGNGQSMARRSLLQLQQSCGNQCVQRALVLAGKAQGETGAGLEVERKIESSRGAGQPLDSAVRTPMDTAFNADFSGVRVHTNSEAGALNRELNARAFTTGRDIFFRHGEYNPGSSSGRELLAHELTHVVQQNGEEVRRKNEDGEACPGRGCSASAGLVGSIQGKLTVGRPGDIYEQEADQTARAFTLWQQRTPSGETGSGLRRQGMEAEKEEETKMRTKLKENSVLRQPEALENEEEEKARAK